MTTLVTGAAGFLGSHVARQLVARGEDVRVLVRSSSSNRAIADLSLEYVTGDLRDQSSLARAMAGGRDRFPRGRRLPSVVQKSPGHLRFECGWHEKFAGRRPPSRRTKTRLHQHRSHHRGRPPRLAQRVHRRKAR